MISFIGLKKLKYSMICFIYIKQNVQKLKTSARTDAAPDARLLVIWLIFQKKALF